MHVISGGLLTAVLSVSIFLIWQFLNLMLSSQTLVGLALVLDEDYKIAMETLRLFSNNALLLGYFQDLTLLDALRPVPSECSIVLTIDVMFCVYHEGYITLWRLTELLTACSTTLSVQKL